MPLKVLDFLFEKPKPEVVVQRLEITGGAYKVEALLTNVR